MSVTVSAVSRVRWVIVALLAGVVVTAGCQMETGERLERSVVSAEWLAQQLEDSTVIPIHIGSEEGYAEEHIPGAWYLSTGDYAVRNDSASGLRNELPEPDVLREKLESIGVSDDSRIVVYADSRRPLFATRLLFTLDYLGVGDRSFLLDGGLPAWKAAGHAVTAAAPDSVRGSLSEQPVSELTVDADWIVARLGSPGQLIVDARSREQYLGDDETEARRGHQRSV